MKKTVFALAALAVVAAPLAAQAHRAWMAPSSTVLSGSDGWISVDAGMSNGVFIPDHAAMRLDGLVITAPDGSVVSAENAHRARYRSTFDVHLTQPGTYKIANVSSGFFASYTLDGERQRWRGAASEFPAALPEGAADIEATENANRIETFATLGAPTQTVFEPTGQGLELVPVTHPNDLIVGEAGEFRLLHDGAPAANVEVTVARGGSRYRDNPEEMTVTTDADGLFRIDWTEAGLYWVNASVRTPAGEGRAHARNVQYTATFEVLP